MSARLHSLGFTPRGPSGWTTPFLEFGRIVTLVHGPNGSGKTPILKGIAFALGYPIELPPDVSRQCESVVLTISDGGNPVRIERVICDDFDVRVSAAEGDARRFSDEKTFTSWVIGLLGIPERSLAGKMKGVVAPYVSTLVPMFWIDQDNGWRNLYSPLATHNFVQDQAEEVARWLLGIPARHVAVDKDALAHAKENHESIEEQIAIKRKTIAALRRELGHHTGPGDREKLLARRESLLAELRARTSVLEVLAQSDSSLDGAL